MRLKKLSDIFSGPTILNYVLPLLIAYLIIGTVAQKYIGLYMATKIFFSSPILWLGPVPLPGLPILLALIFVNLCFKLFFKSPWKKEHAGIIITHIGALFLLLGGLFTALFSTEGYVDLAPHDTKSYVTDYHTREFVLMDENNRVIWSKNHKDLKENTRIDISEPPLSIEILETCRNCEIKRRKSKKDNFVGMAQHMALSPDVLKKEDEENIAGTTFAVKGSDNEGVYLSLEIVPQLPEIFIGNKVYKFAVQKQQRNLPFSIQLLEFNRDMHPGTELAKSYQSRVKIIDGDAEWESLISMNEPLRYKGYTLFQSSFIEASQGDISILAVVWNAGRAFPYISGIALCIGIIVHLLVRIRKKPAKRGVKHAA